MDQVLSLVGAEDADYPDTQLQYIPHPVTAPGRSGGRRRNEENSYKRLIVCCDGTWLNSDDGMHNGKLATPSNVTRISRAIKPETSDGVQQIVYYHYGVGSRGGALDRVFMGATGEGLADNVRTSYSFLANNYAPGDEIFLIGFSRGAYTARAIAGIISVVGLLTKKGLTSYPEIFRDVQHRRDRNYRPANPNVPFPRKPSAQDPRYKQELYRRGLTSLDVSVKAIGVWDTVGSLGLPRLPLLTKLGIQKDQSKEMSFYDTKISNTVENAFQALALDERRSAFSPAVWEKPAGNKTILRQVWFPGVHSNIGGGYDDNGIANLTLAWMMTQLSPFLDFYDDYVREQGRENTWYYKDMGKKPRPWSFGKITNSLTGIYAIGGGMTRTPGKYYAVGQDGNISNRPLRDTREFIHPSVRTRIRLRGPGVGDEGQYDPESMDDWRLNVEYIRGGDGRDRDKPDIFWRARFKERNVTTRILPESPISGFELDLLEFDEDMEEYVFQPPASTRRRN